MKKVNVKISLALKVKDPEDTINYLDNVKELLDNSGLDFIEEVYWDTDDIED